jgi:hypothetical protein
MSETIGTNGNDLTVTIPSSAEVDWATSIRNNCFQKISDHTHEASGAGKKIRAYLGLSFTDAFLPNNTDLLARNVAGTGTVVMYKVNASDELEFAGATTLFHDDVFKIGDEADTTKALAFSLGGATTASTVTLASAHTADRTLTLPDTTDTLVGRDTTDTLTNKTLTSPILNSPTLVLDDDSFTLQDDGDATKQLQFQLSGITTATTRTLTVPDANDTLLGRATTDTLTNKTLTSPVLNTGVSGTAVLDEDNMASDSATQLATQQSIKAYADTKLAQTVTTTGDLIYSSSGATASRLGIGSVGQVLLVAGGIPTWGTNTSAPIAPTSKTTTYTATTSDETILADTSGGAWTLTLYSAASNAGRKLTVKKTTSDTNALSIDADGSETIDTCTVKLLQGENQSITMISDGTNWKITDHPIPQTAYIKDIKTTGTAGGASTASTVQVRDLTTISGDASIVTLSSNQFTLQAGEYAIEAYAPGFLVNRHQVFLYNTSDSTYDIDGQPTISGSTSISSISSLLGTITITAAKVYEIRHWTQSTQASNGLGVEGDGTNNPQSAEVYTTVKITKLRC